MLWNLNGLRNEETTPNVSSVVTDGTRIYFYSDVTADKVLELTRQLRQMDEKLSCEKLVRDSEFNTPIWLHINSGGGEVFSALAVADLIPRLNSPVYTVTDGLVASAATVFYLVGAKRYIHPNGFMCIHELSSTFWGKHSEFKDQLRLQEMLMDKFIKFYAKYTKLTETELEDKLTHDFWLDAEQALELGFADSLLGETK